MNIYTTPIVLILMAFSAEACHHMKQDFPPDTFPEDTLIRKKRGSEIYIFNPTKSTPGPVDVEKDVSDFFTKCMHEKTGSVFRSWRSVIDFVLRDTRWYSSSEDQYCPENTDKDPKSTDCWKKRLDSLMKLDSRLLSKAKECVEEFVWSVDEGPFIIRGKRQTPTYSSNTLERCLRVTRSQYDGCLKDGLLTTSNLRQYPSLKEWDGPSVDQFITDHISSCRITSRYINGRNVYSETCSRTTSSRSFFQPAKPCLSEAYNEIVRTSSPLFGVQKGCTAKYNPVTNPCQNVRCSGQHESCDRNTGKCVCDAGYVKNSQNICVLQNKCIFVFCGGRHEECNQNTGLCECVDGYRKNSDGICTLINKCRFVVCRDPNQICNALSGQCQCLPGFDNIDGQCIVPTSDPCDLKICPHNERCYNFGGIAYCICPHGFRIAFGRCIEHTNNPCSNVHCGANAHCSEGTCFCDLGYTRRDGQCKHACEGVVCPLNSECKNGRCNCSEGFEENRFGFCVRVNPCQSITCGRNMECKVNWQSGNAECECLEDYVKNPFGSGCISRDPCANVQCCKNSECVNGDCRCLSGFVPSPQSCGCIPPDPCASVQCPVNSNCVRGRCVCRSGFEMVSGVCKRINPCSGVRCDRNMRCVRGQCVCRVGFVESSTQRGCVHPDPCANVRCCANSNCINGNCVCLSGFIGVNGGCPCRRIDPCSGVTCDRNMRCVRGQCVCRVGFVESSTQRGCVRPDPCANVRCCANSNCVNGNCVCLSGFIGVNGGCPCRDPCAIVRCGANSTCVNGQCVCEPGFTRVDGVGPCLSLCESFCDENEICTMVGTTPRCRCKPGFTLNQIGECVRGDICATVRCGPNMRCVNGNCRCLSGFVRASSAPGCVIPDPCQGVNCPPDSQCVNGECVCDQGFQKVRDICLRRNPCDGVRCGQNQRCVNGICECLPGFVAVPEAVDCILGTGVWKPWMEWKECSASCDGGVQFRDRECDGSNCVGDLVQSRRCNTHNCNGGCPPGKVFRACAPLCYDRCGGRVTPDDVSSCFSQRCRPDVNCVCPDGQVERSSTDSTCISRDRCPGKWRPWGTWGSCTVTCDGGVQIRSRSCDGTGCEGDQAETRQCNSRACREGRCLSPKLFNQCPTRCPKTCMNHGIEIVCESGCREGTTCVCPTGMVERSAVDSTCVRPEDCQVAGPCFPNPCQNGGTCIPIGFRYMCECADGFTGRSCESRSTGAA